MLLKPTRKVGVRKAGQSSVHAEDGFVFRCQLHPEFPGCGCVCWRGARDREGRGNKPLWMKACLAFVHISLMWKGCLSCSSLLAPAEPQWEREKARVFPNHPPKERFQGTCPLAFSAPSPGESPQWGFQPSWHKQGPGPVSAHTWPSLPGDRTGLAHGFDSGHLCGGQGAP